MSEPFVGEIRMFAGNFAPRAHTHLEDHPLALFATSKPGHWQTDQVIKIPFELRIASKLPVKGLISKSSKRMVG